MTRCFFMDPVVHFEIPAENLQRAQKFYSTCFSWKIEKYPMPDPGVQYYGIHTVDIDEKTRLPKEVGAINGGMMKKDATAPYPIIVMNVSSIEESLKKAEANGAKIVMPAVNVMGMGLYARITDTEGNIVGVWQNLKAAQNQV